MDVHIEFVVPWGMDHRAPTCFLRARLDVYRSKLMGVAPVARSVHRETKASVQILAARATIPQRVAA